MSANELELFVHLPGKRPSVVNAESTETLRSLLRRLDLEADGVDHPLVFIGECDDALKAPRGIENGADAHIPVALDDTLDDLGLEKHRHIHCHRCRHVTATIKFARSEIKYKFSPATTIEVVTSWSKRKLRLDAVAASDFVLHLAGTMDQPRPSQHLGELVKDGECDLSFELVKEMTPQG